MTLRYVTNGDYRRQKSALTRALNSGEPRRVIMACERVVSEWQGCAWPDDWSRWDRALLDACCALQRAGFACELVTLEDLDAGRRVS